MQPLVLSSASPSRKALLERLLIPFCTFSPDLDESPLPDETPISMVSRLAEAKARRAASTFPDALIIGSDQMIIQGDQVVGKPLTHEAAVRQLEQASGRSVTAQTGLCLLNAKTGNLQIAVEPYVVHFRILTPEMIEGYLKRERPYHCAGSIKAEALGVVLFKAMEGKDPSALTGLPLIKLTQMLENEGINLL